MAGPTDSTSDFGAAQPGIERAKMIVNELASAAQSAALSLVDEQKTRAADQVNSFAQALHAAGQSFEKSDRPIAAEYTRSAALQIEAVVDTIRNRHWTEIVADLEEMARHRPVRFVAGAVLMGFIVGRLLTTATRHPQRSRPDTAPAEVRAAVASASGNGEMTGWQPPTGQTQGLP